MEGSLSTVVFESLHISPEVLPIVELNQDFFTGKLL